ncbi:MAG: hypothetical protein KF764_31565 [Labilithrix sp.]|nr:hypothetical protein [Labilithrix sp.]
MKKSDLSAQQSREIRRRSRGGESLRSLAREFGVHVSSISDIVHGRAHVPAVRAVVDDDTMERLEQIAGLQGTTVEELVAGAARRIK